MEKHEDIEIVVEDKSITIENTDIHGEVKDHEIKDEEVVINV